MIDAFKAMKNEFRRQIEQENWQGETVRIKVRTLTPEEAIGNPEHRDYPLIKGRERMMAADFKGAQGQAFTDMFGDYQGTLGEVVDLKLTNNFRRAVFISSLNAVMRARGLVKRTIHCRDHEPPACAAQLADYIADNFDKPKIGMVGLQPRMVEVLSQRFPFRVTDMDQDNIGEKRFNAVIEGPEQNQDMLDWCDLALITGTTLSNDTLVEMMNEKPIILYGVTAAAPAEILNLTRFCPYGK